MKINKLLYCLFFVQIKGKYRNSGKNRLRPQNTHKLIHSFCGQLGEALFCLYFPRRLPRRRQNRPSEKARVRRYGSRF